LINSSPSLWQKVRGWLPGVLISAIALIVLLRVARWQDLGMAFTTIRPWNMAVAIGLTVLSLFFRAFGWRVLLEGKASIKRAFLIINEGYLLNNLLPFKAGEIGRAVFMGRASQLGTFHVLSTVVIERIFDVGIAAGLLLVTLPYAIGAEWARSVGIITLSLVVVGFVTLFFMARFHSRVHAWMETLSEKRPWIRRLVLPRISALLEGLGILTRPRQFVIFLIWILLSWALWTLIYYVMLIPLTPGVQFWWAIFLESVLALGVAIPSAPAALGVYEAAMVGGLSILGISPTLALAYAIAMHFMQFTVTGILGFTGLIREGRSFSTILAELRAPQSP
jgi:glycosyltransferase 2 family protein